MFFELPQYRIKNVQRDLWVKFMEEEIVAHPISNGVVVIGSFVGQDEEHLL